MELLAGSFDINIFSRLSIQAGMIGENEEIGGATTLDPIVKYMQGHSRFAWILQQIELINPNIRNLFLKGEIIKKQIVKWLLE